MKLYEVTFNTWNDSFSGLHGHKTLAVGTDSKDAILRVRQNTERDARDFKATEIKTVLTGAEGCTGAAPVAPSLAFTFAAMSPSRW